MLIYFNRNFNYIASEDEDKKLNEIIKKYGLPQAHFEKIVRFDENDGCETLNFKIGNIKTKRLKWYNPFSWFNRSIILEDCEFINKD